MALHPHTLSRWWALGLVSSWLTLWTVGCTATQAGTGGSGRADSGLPSGVSVEHLEEAADAEVALLSTQLWRLAGTVGTRGARLSFTFWNQHGALTLTRFSVHDLGGPAAAPVDAEATRHTLSTVLSRYSQVHTGEVTLWLHREQAHWAVGYSASAAPRPPEARTLPVLLRDFPAATVLASTEGLRPLLASLQVPTGGAGWAEVDALLEDGRIEGWNLRIFQLTRSGGKPRALSPRATQQAVQALLPFTLGLGPRTVRLRLQLAHRPQDTHAHGWVEAAHVERPAPLPSENAAFVAEYRAMHEHILWRWRHEVREGSAWLAQRGIEEAASWYAGGLFLKGGGYLALWAGSVTRRALARGGEAAAGWLRTALSRLPGDKKKQFEQLWAKAQLEGERALSAEEQSALRGLVEHVEQLVRTRLDIHAKKRLRDAAREHYKKLHPEFRHLLEQQGMTYPIHHRRQLEHAHLFPDLDINAGDNLAMVHEAVHKSLNRAWDRFRQLRPEPTAAEVQRAFELIDTKFKPWYHQVGKPPGSETLLGDTEKAVADALHHLFPK